MISSGLNRWLSDLKHPSDETLISLLDGELGGRTARSTEKHLEHCWACRQRVGEMQRAIGSFVEYRQLRLSREDNQPPHGWSQLPLLLAAARTNSQQSKRKRLPNLFRLRTAVTAAACLSLVGFVWMRLGSVATVSAKEILARMEEVERLEGPGAGRPVLKQRLRVVRRSAGEPVAATEIDVWQDVSSQGVSFPEDGQSFPAQMEPLRQFGELKLFSAAAFTKWRLSLVEREEKVSALRLPDGASGYRIQVRNAGLGSMDGILENAILVRADVWRPVSQQVRLRFKGRILEFDMFREAYAYVAPLDPHRSPTEPSTLHPLAAAEVAEKVRKIRQVPGDWHALKRVEVEARFALHRMNLCLDNPLEIAVEEDTIAVRGLVATAERKQQIAAALGAIGKVTVEIQTTESAGFRAPGLETEETVSSANSSLQGSMLPSLAGVPEGEAAKEMVRIANVAVSASTSALSHAWELKRLAERYTEEEVALLEPAAAWLLETMIRAHLEGLDGELGKLRQIVPADRGETTPSGEVNWRAGNEQLFEEARTIDLLIRGLFAPSTASGRPAGAAMERLRRSLEKASAEFTSVQSDLAAEFSRTFADTVERKVRR